MYLEKLNFGKQNVVIDKLELFGFTYEKQNFLRNKTLVFQHACFRNLRLFFIG